MHGDIHDWPIRNFNFILARQITLASNLASMSLKQ